MTLPPRVAQLYALLHRGTTGDLAFYRATCAGGARVLELGAGAGRVAIDLAERGHAVVGLDREPALLGVAREQALEAGDDVRERLAWVEGDMRDFALAERFDRVIIPFNTLCCLLSPAEVARCLICTHRHLEPGAKLAFDIYRGDPDATVDEGETHLVRIEHDDRTWDVYERSQAHDDPFRADTCYRFLSIDDGEVQHLTIPQRLIDDLEIERALRAAGFTVSDKHGGFGGEPLEDESPHLVVVATA